jgi:UTP--glucose-1-phosphate uridylyltransferase
VSLSGAVPALSVDEILERYGFDELQFEELRARVASGELSRDSNLVRGELEPLADDELTPLPEDAEADLDGVAVAVLNGGMATRFGGAVKGLVEAVDGVSFLDWKLRDAERAGVPVVLMNSFATDEETREHLGDRDGLVVFSQSVSLRLNPDGSVFPGPSPYSPGHGDFAVFAPVERLRAAGLRTLMLSNVDNLGARVDPRVLAAHRAGGNPLTVEVASAEGDPGGAPVRVDGRPQIVEGFRFPPSFDPHTLPVFNTNSLIVEVEALEHRYPLTWLYVEKEVDGQEAVQLERLVNELSAFLPTTFLHVPRHGPRSRFVPVKTPEDLERARPLLRELLATSLF